MKSIVTIFLSLFIFLLPVQGVAEEQCIEKIDNTSAETVLTVCAEELAQSEDGRRIIDRVAPNITERTWWSYRITGKKVSLYVRLVGVETMKKDAVFLAALIDHIVTHPLLTSEASWKPMVLALAVQYVNGGASYFRSIAKATDNKWYALANYIASKRLAEIIQKNHF